MNKALEVSLLTIELTGECDVSNPAKPDDYD